MGPFKLMKPTEFQRTVHRMIGELFHREEMLASRYRDLRDRIEKLEARQKMEDDERARRRVAELGGL